jgi:hypothetical protein
MRFRITPLAMLAMLAISSSVVIAGPVQIQLFDSSKYDDWICGTIGPPTLPGNQGSCGSAKFGKCSDCPGLLIQNNSHAPVKLAIKIVGPGFQEQCAAGAFVGIMRCPSGASVRVFGDQNGCGNLLKAGESCIVSALEFCPQQAGAVQGEAMAFVSTASGQHQVVSFPLLGSGDYTPALAAADAAMRRHLAELLSVPHVRKVELNNAKGDIAIDVEVTDPDKIDQVRRAVQPEIGGYRTEVTVYDEVFCAE